MTKKAFEMSGSRNKSNRIKAWDTYLAFGSDSNYALSVTVADYGFYGVVECAVYDFITREKHVCTEKPKIIGHKPTLSFMYEKECFDHKSKYCNFHIDRDEQSSHIYCKYDRCFIHTELEADLHFSRNEDSGVLVGDLFEKNDKYFCRNVKMLSMDVGGYVRVKGKTYIFDSQRDLGTFDFYRGVFPYKYTDFGGVGSGFVNGKPVGIAFYNQHGKGLKGELCCDGKCTGLCDVKVEEPARSIMAEWSFTANNRSFDGEFKPFFNDRADENNLVFSKHGDRLFGKFNGKATLDDGSELLIEDITVLCEKVNIRW